MASKKKHIGPPGYGPKEEKHFERARKARQWNEDNIKRFVRVQCRKRDWIKFGDIAKSCSELDGSAVPNEAARENAYTMLESDLLAGRFEEGRRSHVRFVFPRARIRERMRRKWLEDAIEHNYDNERGRLWLQHCWLPRKLFERWCAWHHLTKLIPCFQPEDERHTQSSSESVRPPIADETAPKASARPQPQRDRARHALKALYGNELPDAVKLSNKLLVWAVNKRLKDEKLPPVGARTIQRAAGRK